MLKYSYSAAVQFGSAIMYSYSAAVQFGSGIIYSDSAVERTAVQFGSGNNVRIMMQMKTALPF
jgi:hypothetical protein